MLEPELVRGSPTRTGGDRVLAGGLQHSAPAQLVGIPDARRICRGQWLWKRRWLRHLGKRHAFPTFPQPRRRRPYYLCSRTKNGGQVSETAHNWPFFLPDGRHLLFQDQFTESSGEGYVQEIRVLDLKT